ncbi:MAG: prephenate dehydratase [Planctomycetes bacterium]|nr:prephenate dehydratase [Planctomycetota bacterium]
MSLDELRKRIDGIDVQIVRLINERAEIAHKIGELKAESSDSVYKPHREEAVYEHAIKANDGPIRDESVRAVFREIMSGCIALEKALKVAYLGPPGTFTHWAARSKFGDSVNYEPSKSLEEVFAEVERGRADYGVVPVENSTEGGIRDTLARFLESPLKVCAEIVIQIHHSLMANCNLQEIKTVYSKGTVFGQTRGWLREHLPDADLADVPSTSKAAELASHQDHAAAIGHKQLTAAYGLELLFENIEDTPDNVTRFFVIGNHMSGPTGDDKTAVLCSVRDKVGALHSLLTPFKEFGINMTKIESFPARGLKWQYYFFIDFIGHPENEDVQQAMEAMKQECTEFIVLGAFPQQADGETD